MSRIKALFFSVTPFLVYSAYHYLSSPFWLDDPGFLRAASAGCLAAIAVIAAMQFFVKDRHYFPMTIFVVLLGYTLLIFSIPEAIHQKTVLSNWLLRGALERPQIALYSALFLVAVVPPILGLSPFTAYFARFTVDEPFWKSKLFRKVNCYMSLFWGFLFFLCIAAQMLPNLLSQIVVPFAIQFAFGMPVTGFLIPYLRKKLAYVERSGTREYITTARDAIKGMPMIFNGERAGGISAAMQYQITGEENFSCYLVVKDGTCSYGEGTHPSPDITVYSPSEVWLKIARGELEGSAALLKRMYSVNGDMGLLRKMEELFTSSGGRSKNKMGRDLLQGKATTMRYYRMSPGLIKNVLAIMGSPRKAGVSKTDILTMSFLEGCREAGATTETVHLKDMNIEHCTGCFTCWTKTPGICVHRDDAAAVIRKEFDADLTVYSFPLYHFGINSLMKKYIERTLPVLEPFLMGMPDGNTGHPVREGYRKEHCVVVISACGFPEAENFNGLSANINLLSNHTSNGAGGLHIVSELYRPASEALGIPMYQDENGRVLGLMKRAGLQVVKEGGVGRDIIDGIASVNIPKEQFRRESNLTWELCIREGKTLPQLQSEFAGGTL